MDVLLRFLIICLEKPCGCRRFVVEISRLSKRNIINEQAISIYKNLINKFIDIYGDKYK